MSNINRPQPYQPVVILGAGRSGTNLLRDGLTLFADVATWPCDEINYIWRSGAKRHPTDELPPESATEATRAKIREAFNWVARKHNAHWVVEKTCANTLRVGFVDKVLPNARYIVLSRDGFDVTASAMKRWSAPIEPRYLACKARFVPVLDLPYYATRYLSGHARRLLGAEKALPTWGPRFVGLDELRRTEPLSVVCAEQWRRCCEATNEAVAKLDPNRVYRLTYEGLVANPAESLAEIAAWLGISTEGSAIIAFAASIRPGSVGAGLRSLSAVDIELIEPIIESLNQQRLAA